MMNKLRLFLLTLVMGLASMAMVAQEAIEQTYTIDLATGSFTGSGNYRSNWAGSELSGLTFSTGANNMNADGNNICIWTGKTKSPYVITVPATHQLVSYSFDFKLRDSGSVTLTVDGKTYTCTSEVQHVEVTGLSGTSTSFTQNGDNKGVTLSNFQVTVLGTPPAPFVVPFETTTISNGEFAADTKWYTMRIKNQFYLSDNAGAEKIVLAGHSRTELADADLWCFVGDAENGYQIYNKQAGATKVLASDVTMNGTEGGATYPTLQSADALPSNYVAAWDFSQSTSISGVEGVYIALHGHATSILNNRDGNLAFWTEGKDAGSTVIIINMEDIVADDACYVFDNLGSSIPYRIPAIAQASNGDIIAVADYRYSKADIGSGNLDLRYRISSDNGQTWGDVKTLISYTYNGGGNLHTGYGDPCIVADCESNRVMVLSCSGNVMFPSGQRNNHQGIARFYSEDNGQTWSKPYDLSDSIYALFDNCAIGTAKSMFVGSGKISQSKTIKVGDYYRIYCAILFKDANGTNKNYALYSDNFGETWSVLGGIDVAPIPSGADEPKADELPDGSVLVSSRVNGGRYFNIFRYTDAEKGEGFWSTSTFSGSDNNGTASPGYTCNGEILTIPVTRKSDNKDMFLQLQSVPFGSGRVNVGIYYKELETLADFNSGASIAKDWDGNHQISYTTSCYSTMVLLANNTIAFLFEESSYNGGYDIVYENFSIEQITNDAYTIKSGVDATAVVLAGIEAELATFQAQTGLYVGNLTVDGFNAIKGAYDAYAATPSRTLYEACNKAVVDAEKIQLGAEFKYRVRNKLYPTQYLVMTKPIMKTMALDESNQEQLVSFIPSENGTWKIYGDAAGIYAGNPGAEEANLISMASTLEAASDYEIVSNIEGLSYFKCLTPANAAWPALHAKNDGRIVRWTTSADASNWYIEPTDIETDIETVVSEVETEPEVFFDLQGRRVESPSQGIYVTSCKRKVMVK